MIKTPKMNATGIFLIAGTTVIIASSIIAHVKAKRDEKPENEKLLAHRVAHASAMERMELVIEQLDLQIDIAKKAILDDEFNQIIQDFQE
jgi:hypothetical protein